MSMKLKLAMSLLPLLALFAQPASAQIRASELARIEQTVDGTKMSMDYSRPRIRGRDTIWGGQIHWDEMWTPGANWATKFRTSRALKVNGHPLPEGTYTLWFRVREREPWTVVFDRDTTRSHVQKPNADSAVVRFDVQPQSGPHVEALTWSFPDYTHATAELEFAWDSLRIPLHIEVTPSQRLHATTAEADRVVGSYAMDWTMQRNQPAKPGALEVTFTPADSTLRATATFQDQDPWELVLAPKADNVFVAIFMNQGQYWSTAESYLFEFIPADERPDGVELRLGTNDRLLGTGTVRPES